MRQQPVPKREEVGEGLDRVEHPRHWLMGFEQVAERTAAVATVRTLAMDLPTESHAQHAVNLPAVRSARAHAISPLLLHS